MNQTGIIEFLNRIVNGSVWPAAGVVFVFSWLLLLVGGRGMIARLKAMKGTKWSPREDTPDSHLAKAGTPSMGGIGIIGSALVVFIATVFFVYLVFGLWRGAGFDATATLETSIQFLFFPLVVFLHMVLGYVDDLSKATGHGGLRARDKLLGQIAITAGFVLGGFLLRTSPIGIGKSIGPWEFAPLAGSVDLASNSLALLAFGIFLSLVLIATSNAVNLTDGIDGLAAGLSVQTGLAFAAIVLLPQWTPGTHIEVALFWLALAGACLGFLAYNKNPAKVFMGDTGSLALGAAVGAGAILTRSVFLLPFIGFIFYIEMFSVMGQVAYFKYTKKKTGEGKRIFRRAPLHHHFELGGWSEWRVVATFWAVNLAMTAIGLILWTKGIIPRFP